MWAVIWSEKLTQKKHKYFSRERKITDWPISDRWKHFPIFSLLAAFLCWFIVLSFIHCFLFGNLQSSYWKKKPEPSYNFNRRYCLNTWSSISAVDELISLLFQAAISSIWNDDSQTLLYLFHLYLRLRLCFVFDLEKFVQCLPLQEPMTALTMMTRSNIPRIIK